MSGYVCDWDDDGHPARFVFMDTATGKSISWCADHFPPGVIPLLGAELGVDPVAFYEHVRKYIDRQVKEAAKPATIDCPQCGTTVNGTVADIDSGLRKHMEHCEGPMDAHSRESRLTDADGQ